MDKKKYEKVIKLIYIYGRGYKEGSEDTKNNMKMIKEALKSEID